MSDSAPSFYEFNPEIRLFLFSRLEEAVQNHIAPGEFYTLTPVESVPVEADVLRFLSELDRVLTLAEQVKRSLMAAPSDEERSAAIERLINARLKQLDGKPLTIPKEVLLAESKENRYDCLTELFLPYDSARVSKEASLDSYSREVRSIERLRTQIQALLTLNYLVRANPSLDPDETLGNLLRDRRFIPAAYVQKGKDWLRAPSRSDLFGLPTVSGLLMQDNMNHIEDHLLAIGRALEIEEEQFLTLSELPTTDKALLAALVNNIQQNRALATELKRYLSAEMSWVNRIKNLWEGVPRGLIQPPTQLSHFNGALSMVPVGNKGIDR